MDTVRPNGRPAGRVALTLRLTPLRLVLLLLALLLPWGVLLWQSCRAPALRTLRNTEVPGALPHREIVSGPWGSLEIEPIILDYPSTHTVFDFDLEPYRRWIFRDATLDTIRQRLAAAGLDAAAVEACVRTASADAALRGFVLRPPDALVRAMTPTVRAAVYSELARDPANLAQAHPFLFRGTTLQEWFVDSGVSVQTMAQIEPLLYRRENCLLFSDPQLVVPGIASRFERARLYQTLRRTATLRVRLLPNAGTAPEAIRDYWGHPDRASEIEPLLTALATHPDGLSIVTFLPDFARSRLYTYPEAHLRDDHTKHDCHWAALNFFRDPPDDSVSTNVSTVLARDYEAVASPSQFGDLALLFHNDRLVHSCVYLAGDIVFTKNGIGSGDPFVLERLDDLVRCYRGVYGNIRLAFARRKGT